MGGGSAKKWFKILPNTGIELSIKLGGGCLPGLIVTNHRSLPSCVSFEEPVDTLSVGEDRGMCEPLQSARAMSGAHSFSIEHCVVVVWHTIIEHPRREDKRAGERLSS